MPKKKKEKLSELKGRAKTGALMMIITILLFAPLGFINLIEVMLWLYAAVLFIFSVLLAKNSLQESRKKHVFIGALADFERIAYFMGNYLRF